MSLSSMVRGDLLMSARLVATATVAALLCSLALTAAPASAMSDTPPTTAGMTQHPPHDRARDQARDQARELARDLARDLRRAEERDRVLDTLFHDLDARRAADADLRAGRLADLGYTGDVSALDTILPIGDYHLSAGFGQSGPLWASLHTGLDFGTVEGTTLVAVGDGIVTEVAYAGPYGIRTILTLDDGTEVWYAHQLRPLVYEGQAIVIGEPIGLAGSTGNSTGPHLHLEVRPGGGDPVDPYAWLAGRGLAP